MSALPLANTDFSASMEFVSIIDKLGVPGCFALVSYFLWNSVKEKDAQLRQQTQEYTELVKDMTKVVAETNKTIEANNLLLDKAMDKFS